MKGTLKELIDNGLKVNGKEVNLNQLCILVKFGVGRLAGYARHSSGKGKSAGVYEFDSEESLSLSVTNPESA